eukprot:9469301-Pyramimonas_sp.AAC.1
MQAEKEVVIQKNSSPVKPAPAATEQVAKDSLKAKTTLNLNIATYNAQRTIVDDKEQMTFANRECRGAVTKYIKHQRGQLMRLQMRDEGVQIAGVQETTFTEEYTIGDGYMQFNSRQTNSKQEKLGVSLMISHDVPYATSEQKEHFFEKKHVRIVHRSERLLIACIRTPIVHETIHVWHVPHHDKGSKQAERVKWWKQLWQLSQKWPPTIVLADANATFSSIPSPGIGGLVHRREDTDDDNAERIREFANIYRVHLLNTIIEHEEKATYTSDGGRQKRIDYIATSKQYLQGTTSVETLQDFDTGTIAKDH